MILAQPSPEQLILIRKTLNEDVTTRNQYLEALKEWLKKQPHLPQNCDDGTLITFLRSCNFSLEKCKKKIDKFFTMRSAASEFFENRNVSNPEIQQILDYAYGVYLPKLTPDGKRIGILGILRSDFETPDIVDVFKIVTMTVEVRLKAEESGVAGDIYIFDSNSEFSKLFLKHFFKMSPAAIMKFLIWVQQAFPNKIKQIHLVHSTAYAGTFLKVVGQFVSKKIMERIFVHQDFDSLHQHVPKELLPEEYGGTAGKLDDFRKEWMKVLEEHTDWFKEQENVKVDESKRPPDQNNYDHLFGIDGSFRQLNID